MLYREAEACLEQQGVHRKGSTRVLVACSGGADSVALSHIVCKILGPHRVVLGHVDHGVRPDSAQAAAQVAQLAKGLGCDVEVARLEGCEPDEASLRTARYAALERLRAQADARFVLTAHTADDQAETVLLTLIRAPQPDLLRGMPAVRGAVLRPWLRVARSEVHRHAARHGLPVAFDRSNLEPRYLRNRVRKELMPLIESRYRPGFAQRLAALAQALAAPEAPGHSAALHDPSPKNNPEPRGLPSGPPPGCLPRVLLQTRPWALGSTIPEGPQRVVFDAQQVQGVQIRPIASGDRIEPFGHPGRRKVRDVLREAGISQAWRRFFPVLTDTDDRVLWVPGLLRSRHALVGETTETVWQCCVDRKDELQAETSRATLDGAEPGAYVPGREKNE